MNGGLQIVLESFLYWQEPGLAFWVMIYHGMAARDTDSGVRGVSVSGHGAGTRGITAEVEQLASCQLNWVIIGSTAGERGLVSSLGPSHHPTHHHVTLPHLTTDTDHFSQMSYGHNMAQYINNYVTDLGDTQLTIIVSVYPLPWFGI